MNIEISRRAFLKGAGAGVGATAMMALGFEAAEAAVRSAVKPFRLAATVQTRQTCTYCSVACGIILYSKGSMQNGSAKVVHVEGDVDHPTNRGTLCPKGAALLDTIHSPNRLMRPKVRKPGSDRFEDISWDEALDKIARYMKDDRDANFVEKNEKGQTVNRWLSTGFLAASATTNETAFLTYKVVRSSGMLVFDNQARV